MTHTTFIRPRYAETDQMGVVYHGNYLTYFEVGRTDFFRTLGYPYTVLEEQGVLFPVIRAELDYIQPARYDDEIQVRTALGFLKGARLELKYEVVRMDEACETLLARGKTIHAFVNREMKPVNLRRAVPEMWTLLETRLEG